MDVGFWRLQGESVPTADLSRMVLKSIFKKEALQDVQFMIPARKMDLRLSLDEGTLYVEITGKVAEGQMYPRAQEGWVRWVGVCTQTPLMEPTERDGTCTSVRETPRNQKLRLQFESCCPSVNVAVFRF